MLSTFSSMFVKVASECWEWINARPNTYGVYNGMTAHRYSYIIHKGAVPKGLHVLHRCNNKKCVNPEHLYAGTHQDNMRDAINAGVMHGGKLSKDDVGMIRSLLKRNVPQWRIANIFHVTQPTISCIKTEKVWKSGRERRGRRRKLSKYQISYIANSCIDAKTLSHMYNVSVATIRNSIKYHYRVA